MSSLAPARLIAPWWRRVWSWFWADRETLAVDRRLTAAIQATSDRLDWQQQRIYELEHQIFHLKRGTQCPECPAEHTLEEFANERRVR